MNVDSDSQISDDDEMAKFRRDDLEFRTITTLLSKLGSRDDRKEKKSVLSPSKARHMKQLASVSGMLAVDHHEEIAILPKRSATVLTLFISAQSKPATETENHEDHNHDDDDESTPLHFITKNPSDLDQPTNSVKLMDIPVIEIGTDIFEYITKNWKPSFEHHAQATAQLIAACYSGGSPEWLRLLQYAIFQSASKVTRRFRNTRSFEVLDTLPTPSEVPVDFPGFSELDMACLNDLLPNDRALANHFPLLLAFVDPARLSPNLASSLALLVEFHWFFLWLLRRSRQRVEALHNLGKCDDPPPVKTLVFLVESALSSFQDLHYFVWESKFFGWYISKYRRLSISDRYAFLCRDDGQTASVASEHPDQDENDELNGGDFPTEFETAGNDEDSADPTTAEQDSTADQIYSWLRLVTSTVQHTLRFHRTTPGPRMQLAFQVINYPKSEKIMKPWQETIAEIGGYKEREIEILNILRRHRNFANFVKENKPMKFTGRAHCEAVLGCLHSLARRGQNLTWAGVPQGVMDHLKTSYSIVAPSKRCCPVCATLISYLSHERGAPILNTLTKHPFIFPTALPVGLPESIRHRLIVLYKARLRVELDTLVITARSLSGLSLQSEPLSVASDDGDEAKAKAKAKVNSLRAESHWRIWLIEWFQLDEPERREEWRRLHDTAPQRWKGCKLLMCSGGGMYQGSKVPDYVFLDNME